MWKNGCFSNCANIYPHAIICRNNLRKFVLILAKNPIFRISLPRLLDFMVNFILNIVNFPIFGKISSNIPNFWCILHENAVIVTFMVKIPSIQGVSLDF